jgi:hypothetical protein
MSFNSEKEVNTENQENECGCTDCHESQIETDDEQECDCEPCLCNDCSCNEMSELFSDTEDGSLTDTEDATSTDDYTENDDKSSILRGKWIYDGSNSIDEMIEALQREIALLEDLKQDGWVLQEKVMDDYAYLMKDDDNN